ncbi:hypothetical protein CDL15_Pgr014375 [Punica granatum]|uniref:Uncharacterized protein n=1 Tax=Punica granatum TaxID=22663 RepID=A0A218WF57_PUNGR|nr:hypothetical protein CDL15_Pgr014375 [Punica granatum]PKI56071.1 hypothetical protein CRG98_023540 [Punica granatum]
MTTLQRSSVSFRRQGSSGRIWNDTAVPERRSSMLINTSKPAVGNAPEEVFTPRPHAEPSLPRSSSSRSESDGQPQKCALSSLFGRCMGLSRE